MAKCNWCHQEILWHKSATSGNLMPLDPIPVNGAGYVIENGEAHWIHGTLFDQIHDGKRYVSHLETCKVRNKPEAT